MRAEAIPSYLEDILSALNPDGSLTIRDTPPQISCRTLPSPLSELEARFYYAGLSMPLVARSSTTPWEVPTGPETYQKWQELLAAIDKPFHSDWKDDVASKREALLDSIKLKELGPASRHPIGKIWKDLGTKVRDLLASMEVKWSSIQVCRIGWEEWPIPVILWIGVKPGSLSGEYGLVVASECHKLLVEHDITDVDVEITESVVTRL